VSGGADLILLMVILLDLVMASTGRLTACIRASALQGALLALLPAAFWWEGSAAAAEHVAVLCAGTFAVKAVVIPWLLLRSLRRAGVRREAEPFVSLHVGLLLATLLVGIAFWLGTRLVPPRPAPSALLVPAALATILVGFLILVARRKAITQVVGYLVVENGVFVFGQLLASALPFVVELGIFLDLLVGVFVMGIAIHHIHREFDHIDTARLATLKD
jgi:hydrogenase-4 component E